MKQRSPNNNQKPSITIMTLLAAEAPKEATELLLSNGGSKAKNFKDLELKLSQMYESCPDKPALEKKLAEIHPHKKWFLKTYEPAIKLQEIKVTPEPTESVTKVDPELIQRITNLEQRSDFLGLNVPKDAQQSSETKQQDYSPMVYGIIGIVAIIGLVIVGQTVLKSQK